MAVAPIEVLTSQRTADMEDAEFSRLNAHLMTLSAVTRLRRQLAEIREAATRNLRDLERIESGISELVEWHGASQR